MNNHFQGTYVKCVKMYTSVAYINTLKQELSGTKAYKETSEEEKSVVNGHCNHLALKFSVCVKERQDRLPTMYWLPKLHKTPYKARFIANSSSCTTNELSKLLTSCLTAVKNHVIRYCEKVYERSGKNLFWSIKNSGEVLNKLKSRGFRATSLSTYDFSTLYTTLPHNFIKEKLINLIEWTFKREGSPYIACNERQAFFTSEDTKRYKLWSCQNVCEALIYLLDNIYIRFGTKLYRQIVGIPMGTNCAPLVADLFLFCYERDFMTSLSDVKQAEIVEEFKSTSRYLDDLLNIDNPYFEGMVNRIYPPELQLNKANTADTEAPFLDLHLSISNGFVSSKIYDDLVYKFKKIVGRVDFSDQFRKIIVRYKRIGYNINIMRQSACLVFNPITVNNFASLFNCTPVGRASDSMMAPT